MYLNVWKDSGIEGMKHDFGIDDDVLTGATVLLASYGCTQYEGEEWEEWGEAFVLFERDGKLYEVYGDRCGYALRYANAEDDANDEDAGSQWQPEETTIESLRCRLDAGGIGRDYHSRECGNVYADELRMVLDALELTEHRDRIASSTRPYVKLDDSALSALIEEYGEYVPLLPDWHSHSGLAQTGYYPPALSWLHYCQPSKPSTK